MASYNLDFFDTYYLAGAVQEISPAPTWFRDRYFPTTSGDMYAADKVLVEYRDGERRLAPFVVPQVGSIPIARTGYTVREYSPPDIKISRTLTLDDLQKRGFGEALLPNTPRAERARRLTMEDLTDLNRRITRREEWLAAQVLQNNGFAAVSYIDNKTVGQEFSVNFYSADEGNTALYTAANPWNAGGDFWGDVETMCGLLADRGLPVADLVIGPAVSQFIQSDENVRKRLDATYRMEYGSVALNITAPGVVRLGRLNFGGFELDIFSVREQYQDTDGTMKRYFPADGALVTAPGCGHMMYARVTQMEDGEYRDFAQPRVPKMIYDDVNDSRSLRLWSRPFAAPVNKSPYIFAPGVVTV
jgi:GNAT superfamily N-acetyltransferase